MRELFTQIFGTLLEKLFKGGGRLFFGKYRQRWKVTDRLHREADEVSGCFTDSELFSFYYVILCSNSGAKFGRFLACFQQSLNWAFTAWKQHACEKGAMALSAGRFKSSLLDLTFCLRHQERIIELSESAVNGGDMPLPSDSRVYVQLQDKYNSFVSGCERLLRDASKLDRSISSQVFHRLPPSLLRTQK